MEGQRSLQLHAGQRVPRSQRSLLSKRSCSTACAGPGSQVASHPAAEDRKKRHKQKLESIKQHRNSLVQLRQHIQESLNQKEGSEELLERVLLPLIRYAN